MRCVGNTGLLSCHCTGNGTHLVLRENLMVFLKLQLEAVHSSRVERGHLRFPLESMHENRASSQVEAGNSAFLVSFDGILGSYRVSTGESGLVS